MAALVELRGVVKHFPVTRSLGEVVRGAHPVVRALEGVSFDIGDGDAIAIVGESGCGKTTLGRLMLKLVEPTAGSIAFAGSALGGLAGQALRDFRRQAQLVFQNPFDALNPRFTIYRAVAEPLLNARIDKAELELTAIIEPAAKLGASDDDPDRLALYRFGVETMEEHQIRVLTTSDLSRVAETARRELRV